MENLYHYTTGAGLLGMMKNYSKENKNLTMWATHYKYMNDPTEYEYGRSICLDIIDDIEKELHIEKGKRIKEVLKKNNFNRLPISKEIENKQKKFIFSPYLISLSRAEDSLHMWNMYAKNGNGIAIIFNGEKLNNSCVPKECIYYEKKKHYNKLKEKINEHYQQHMNTFQVSGVDPLIANAYGVALLISLLEGVFIKHFAYREEMETRIHVSIAEDVLFRDKEGLIIPYVEQQIPFECVENIIVGPTADFDRVCESIWLLMNSKGIKWKEDKIIKSNVPYRI